jgi:ketosteroid isomerase-like protein
MEASNEALAVAKKFVAALNVADAEAVRAAYAPDARIWHNFEDKLQSVDENIETMHWVHSKLSKLDYDVQKLMAVPGGFLQQHILRGTLASGEAFAMHACVICKGEDGRITELEEYLDTGQAKPLFQ